MGVLMGFLGFSILGEKGDLGVAQRQILALVHQARTTAVAMGSEARLIISVDPKDAERNMRFARIVIREDLEDKTWRELDEGTFLTEGIWFVDKQESETESNWMEDAFCNWSQSDDELFGLDAPVNGIRKEGKAYDYKYVAFDPSGTTISADYPKMPRLVVASGNLRSSDGAFSAFFSNTLEVAGVEIRPFGGILSLDFNDFSKNE